MKVTTYKPRIISDAQIAALRAKRSDDARAAQAEREKRAKEKAKIDARPPLRDFQPVDDPLDDVPDTGSVQGNAKAELQAVQTSFYARRDESSAISLARGDSEYWFAAIFETRDQKEAFLKAIGIFEVADKYIDGRDLAEAMHIELPPSEIDWDARDGNKTRRD